MAVDLERFQADLDRFNDLGPKLRGESDRATAVLTAAYLGDRLRQILSRSLVAHPSVEALFQGYAPLSTFSARIDLLFALGVFQDSVRRELHLIRRVRNHFAHGTEIHAFSDVPVKDLCMQLRPAVPEFLEWLREKGENQYRSVFFVSSVELSIDLMVASSTAQQPTIGRIEGSGFP